MTCLLLTSLADIIFGSTRLLPLCYIMCSQLREAGPQCPLINPHRLWGSKLFSCLSIPCCHCVHLPKPAQMGLKSPGSRISTILKAQVPVLLAFPEQPRVPLCSIPLSWPLPIRPRKADAEFLRASAGFSTNSPILTAMGELNTPHLILLAHSVGVLVLGTHTFYFLEPWGSALESDLTQREKLFYPKRSCQRRHLKHHPTPLFI